VLPYMHVALYAPTYQKSIGTAHAYLALFRQDEKERQVHARAATLDDTIEAVG
jgi:hypothetical protein